MMVAMRDREMERMKGRKERGNGGNEWLTGLREVELKDEVDGGNKAMALC